MNAQQIFLEWFKANLIFTILCMIPFLNIITCNPIAWLVMIILNLVYIGKVFKLLGDYASGEKK